jgi:hypothetical protein
VEGRPVRLSSFHGTIQAYPTRHKFLDTAYKLRGKLAGDAPVPPIQNTYNLFYQPQFQAKLKSFETDVKDIIAHENAPTSEAPVAAQ